MYKIFAKVLQKCLQATLMDVIDYNHLDLFPFQFIVDNIFLLHETMAWLKKSCHNMLFFKLNFSKVYDKVDHGHLCFKCKRKLESQYDLLALLRLHFKG
jgi:hypothetical protein